MSRIASDSEETVTSRDVAKGAGTTLLARLGGVIDVVAQPLYAALFGLAGFGLYATLWAAVNLIENVADLGMTSALQRTVPQAKSERDAVASLRAAIIMGVGPCLIIALVVCLFAPSFSHIFNADAADQAKLAQAIALFVWTLPLWAFVEIATSALRAKRVFGAEVRLRLFWEQVARMVIAVSLWLAGASTMALFYAHIASLVIICGLCIRLVSRYYDLRLLFHGPLFDDVWHDTTKAGLAVLPANIVARLFGDAPTIALNAMLPGAAGATAAGLFSISRKISSIVQLVRTAFAYVLSPLASAASTASKASVGDIYGFSTRVSFAVAVPLGAVLAAAGPALLSTFGKGAAVALPALVILIFARIVEAIFGAAVPIQQVIAGYKSQLVGSITGLGFALLLGWLLMPQAGLTGITAAVGLGLVTAAGIPLWQLHRYDDIHPFARPFGTILVRSTLVALLGGGAMLAFLLLPRWTQLVVVIPILLATLWTSMRVSLPLHDRLALGKLARVLKLV